jgi:hypothetical protein
MNPKDVPIASVTCHNAQMETPRGTITTTTYEWNGPKDGVLRWQNHWPREIFWKLDCRLVGVGEDDFGKLYMRADAGFFATTFYRLRVKYYRRFDTVPLRLQWIAIMLGLATARQDPRFVYNPIDRWFWQRPPKNPTSK